MIETVRDILQLPPLAFTTRNLPKSFFDRNFRLTASEKKFLNTPFLPIRATWSAELNSKTINVPIVEETTFSYTRLPIFVIELSVEHWLQHLDKLCNLYHKYIPFQVLLFMHNNEQYCVSAATKSINQNDTEKRVLEQEYRTPEISLLLKDDIEVKFREQLSFQNLNRINLKTVYDSYIAAIVNYRRATKAGNFEVRKEVQLVHQNLNELEQIDKESIIIKNKILKSKDIRDKVELQMQLQHLRDRKIYIESTL